MPTKRDGQGGASGTVARPPWSAVSATCGIMLTPTPARTSDWANT